MKTNPEQLALQNLQTLCQGHADALSGALQDMQLRALGTEDHTHLNKDNRRLLDQFAYRYTRLQDDMGARLMPAVLKALGEDIAPMSAIDRFAHDYPDNPTERFERLQAAIQAAHQLLMIMAQFQRQAIGMESRS